MKILIYEWEAYQYRDIIQGFLLLGHQTLVTKERPSSYDEDPAWQKRFEKRIREEAADLVFTVNYFGVISDACESCQVPYVIWTCDSGMLSLRHRSIQNKENRLFFFDRADMEECRLLGAKAVYHLPLASDIGRFDEVLRDAETEPLHEISFIGSLYEKNSYDELREKMDPYLRGYFDAAIEAQLSVSGGNLFDTLLTPDILVRVEELFRLEKSEGSWSDLGTVFSGTVLGFKAASEMRIRALTALSSRFDTVLYSNSRAEGLPIQRFPSADYWNSVPGIYRRSKINLNFTIPNIRTGLPLRIFDILSARGFLLTDYRAELPDCFTVGKDLACYESIPELVEKCSYYLSHEEERREIAENGYRTVKERHQMKERLEKMLDIIFPDEKNTAGT